MSNSRTHIAPTALTAKFVGGRMLARVVGVAAGATATNVSLTARLVR